MEGGLDDLIAALQEHDTGLRIRKEMATFKK
jgi:hypothetical protein